MIDSSIVKIGADAFSRNEAMPKEILPMQHYQLSKSDYASLSDTQLIVVKEKGSEALYFSSYGIEKDSVKNDIYDRVYIDANSAQQMGKKIKEPVMINSNIIPMRAADEVLIGYRAELAKALHGLQQNLDKLVGK